MKEKDDKPGVIAPPPLIFLGGLMVGFLISWFYPFGMLSKMFGYAAGASLLTAGLVIIFIVRSKMKKANTNIQPWKPTNAILSDGVFAYSRNPVYVGMILIYIGVVFLLDSLWVLPPLFLVLLAMHYGVILREERYLERKFGEEYLVYKQRVRRWI